MIRTEDQAKSVVLARIRQLVAVLESQSPQGELWIVESNRIRVRGSE